MTRQRITGVIGLIATAFFITLGFMLFYPVFISRLPRHAMKESVIVPWAICLAGYLVLPVLIPWIASLGLVPSPRRRLLFLLALCAFTVLWYLGLDMHDALSKAWRRGL